MYRPLWDYPGRKSEAGVPEALLHGKYKANRQSRLSWKRKKAEYEQRMELLASLKKHTLSPWQKLAGARMVA